MLEEGIVIPACREKEEECVETTREKRTPGVRSSLKGEPALYLRGNRSERTSKYNRIGSI